MTYFFEGGRGGGRSNKASSSPFHPVISRTQTACLMVFGVEIVFICVLYIGVCLLVCFVLIFITDSPPLPTRRTNKRYMYSFIGTFTFYLSLSVPFSFSLYLSLSLSLPFPFALPAFLSRSLCFSLSLFLFFRTICAQGSKTIYIVMRKNIFTIVTGPSHTSGKWIPIKVFPFTNFSTIFLEFPQQVLSIIL